MQRIKVRGGWLTQRRFMLSDFGWNSCTIVRTGNNDHKTQAQTFSRGNIYAYGTGDEREQLLPEVDTLLRPLVTYPGLVIELGQLRSIDVAGCRISKRHSIVQARWLNAKQGWYIRLLYPA